ncbi:CDP-diacylglycerol/serine O-phosphatidyltransferase [Nitrosococcus halophilus Nc 4]|uniref:CDP-diacylglycerol/serine O-phosphatidyltransferase n=1 Tax=Nitrosococcus halophilus (strain Nc4) TaxID=472759 RepID=D5BZS1_NITHN|nr:CDP-diacylglycerol--serine O-phosphatidyltransferase [Nitrosococcus halophilus]ADE14366.1 CDP-diacylglycerol/serine O-phosphatidyltransferase [Nitrosococcus halophilus Nc 4]
MRIISLIGVSHLFTVANLCSGMWSIFFFAQGGFTEGASLLLVAVALDTLDGKVAELMGQKNAFRRQLDSLADLVSFGVAPVFLYYMLDFPGAFVTTILLFFVTCGMLRLARYNISQQKDFEGVPITVNGIIFPLLYAISLIFPGSLSFWPVVFAIMGLLMVSSIRIKRLF